MRHHFPARTARLLAAALLLVLPACGGGDVTSFDDEDGGRDSRGSVSSLNTSEQQMLGLWRRFHAYDGSEEYWRFNANRTACRWEEPNSSESRINVRSYTRWSINTSDTSLGTNRYRVIVDGSGLTSGLTFDYATDRMWPTGFTNLVFSRSSLQKAC